MTFEETAHYDGVAETHNIAINEETGVAFLVGASGTPNTCGGGLHMVDVTNPIEPVFLGCYADPSTGRRGTGYTHDVECIVYDGPDPDYQGREVCFGSNETAIQITDVTDRAESTTIAVATYPGATYVHQGWLSADRKYFYQNDELDESFENPLPRTFIWNVEDLDDPVLASTYTGVAPAIDHNLFLKDGFMYQSNYASGVRILSLDDPENPVEVAFFDTAPSIGTGPFGGSWATYPFFESGNLVATSALEGLFVLRASGIEVANEAEAEVPEGYALGQNYPNPFNPSTQIQYTVPAQTTAVLTVTDQLGRVVATLFDGEVTAGSHTVLWDASGFASGIYFYRLQAGDVRISKAMFLAK